MAGDWIKMRMDLPDDPAVYKLASITKLDRLSVVGRLYAFWAWADKHAVDGRVDGATSQVVDDVTRFDGFAAALLAVKWLEIGDDFVAMPNHERHNGESAKERGLKNARQARWREGKEKAREAVDAAPSTQASTREEKRREEKKEKTSAPNAVAFDASTGFFQIPDLLIEQWKGAYPALSLDVELSRASAWLIANPKNAKSNYARFLTNWLTKAQDRAPRVTTGHAQTAFEGGI